MAKNKIHSFQITRNSVYLLKIRNTGFADINLQRKESAESKPHETRGLQIGCYRPFGACERGGFNLKLHIYLIMEGGNGLKRLEIPTLDQEYVDLERVLASKAALRNSSRGLKPQAYIIYLEKI